VTDTTTRPNRARLIDLGRWLTKEERKRRLGQPSHWNQGVWVQTDTDDIDELPIEVAGKPGSEQPVIVNWSCGTAACAAGHISLEDGGAPAFTYQGDMSPLPPAFVWNTNDPYDWLETLSSSSMYFGGQLESIEEHAQRALGLENHDASRLFHGDNTWGDMVSLISEFADIGEGALLSLIGGVDMPDDPDAEDDDEERRCDCGCNDDYDE
jgi:hypothetical protein